MTISYPRGRGQTTIDFARINVAARARLPEILHRLFPAGRVHGAEFHIGNLRGDPGHSLRVKLQGDRAGVWCDFATGERGGDPVSLVAAVWGIKQSEAARRLADILGEAASHG